MRGLLKKYWVNYRTREVPGDEPYGRDRTIEDIQFKEGVSCDYFAENYLSETRLSDADTLKKRAMTYALSRIASICDLWDTSLYEARVRKGYYGEVVDHIGHTYESKAKNMIHKYESMIEGGRIREMIFDLLREEYGFVLDHLQESTLSEEKVNLTELTTPNEGYAGKVPSHNYYVNPDIPIGVYFEKEVVDGYNRFATLKGNPDVDRVYIYNFTQ